jgi:excisionase family DNA binding protein
LPHQLVGDQRSGTAHDRQGIAATGVDRVIAQGVDGRFDGNDCIRRIGMAHREPGRKLISKARAKGGFVPYISQSRSLDLAMLRPVEKNDARIWAMIVGKDRSDRLQIVHGSGIDPACFDKIGAGNRPLRLARNSVSRREFVKGPAVLLRSDVTHNRKGQSDFGDGDGSKVRRECPAGGGKVFASQVHLKVNRPYSSDSGLVIEPAISGDNDVVTLVLGAIRDALGFDLEAVPAEQFPQGNVAHAVGQVAVQLVLCYSSAPVHECQYEREESGPCPQFGATLGQLNRLNCPEFGSGESLFQCIVPPELMQSKAHRRRFIRGVPLFNSVAPPHRTWQFSIASEAQGKAGNQEFMCAKEAAAWLGIPLRSLHHYVRQGLLPSYKLGRHRLFRKAELLSAA